MKGVWLGLWRRQKLFTYIFYFRKWWTKVEIWLSSCASKIFDVAGFVILIHPLDQLIQRTHSLSFTSPTIMSFSNFISCQVTCKIKSKLNVRHWFFQYLRLVHTKAEWCTYFADVYLFKLLFQSLTLSLLLSCSACCESSECRLFSRFILVKMIRQTSATFRIYLGLKLLAIYCLVLFIVIPYHSHRQCKRINRAKHYFQCSVNILLLLRARLARFLLYSEIQTYAS